MNSTHNGASSQGKGLSTLRAAYSLAAGAAAASTAASTDAAVVYSGSQNISIAQFASQNLNLDGDAYGDVKLKNYILGGGNYQGATVNFFPGKLVGFTSGSLAYASALGAGVLVDSMSAGPTFYGSMAYGGVNPNAQFNNVSGAFLGLGFPIGAGTHYGWVRVDVNNAAGTFVIKDWAYESQAGVGILTGAVPEPTTLGMLAAGAAGLATLRKRRAA
jgi:hypothetical protein